MFCGFTKNGWQGGKSQNTQFMTITKARQRQDTLTINGEQIHKSKYLRTIINVKNVHTRDYSKSSSYYFRGLMLEL